MTLPTKAACQPSCKHAGWAGNTPGIPTLTVMQRLMNGFGGLRMEFERERWHLVQIQKATEAALSSAKKFSGRGDARIAEPWIRHCEETLEGVKKALAIDDEPSTFAGDLVRASPNQLSRF